MTTNEAAEAAKAVQRAWLTSRLVLGAYMVTGTLVLCWIAVADPVRVVNGSGFCFAVAGSIVVPQIISVWYRMARGKKLAKATWNTERYDLTSPDTYYYTSNGYEKSRTGSYGPSRTDPASLWDRLRVMVLFRYVVLMLAGFCVATAVAAAVVNHSPTATTTATVTQCTTNKEGTGCSGTWTVAGKAYSADLWWSGWHGGGPEPAVGSTLPVTYDARYPSVLGKQSVSGGVGYAVFVGLIGSGLGFWNYSRYKPYRAELDAIAARPAPAAAARRPALDKPPARDGRRTSRKHGQ